MKEAQRHQPSATTVEDRFFRGTTTQHKITANLAADGWLSAEMVCHTCPATAWSSFLCDVFQVSRDNLPGVSDSNSSARLSSSLLRIRMSQLMQHRRTSAASFTPTAPSSSQKQPSVLLWTVDILTTILRVYQYCRLLPDADLFIPPLHSEAMSQLRGHRQAGASTGLKHFLRGSLITKEGLRITWQGLEMAMQTQHGVVPLVDVSQVEQMLELQR